MIDINELRQSLGAVTPEEIAELLDRLEAAEKERDDLRALVVMRFDHDYPPQFTQGYDLHELTEPVTAEHCRWFVAEIARLRADCDALRAELSKQQVLTDAAQNIAEVAQSRANQLQAKIERMRSRSLLKRRLFTQQCSKPPLRPIKGANNARRADEVMTPAEAATILRQFNEWRQSDEDIPQLDPCKIGEAIDAAGAGCNCGLQTGQLFAMGRISWLAEN